MMRPQGAGGPRPGPLDLLPIQVYPSGEVQIIDMEFKPDGSPKRGSFR